MSTCPRSDACGFFQVVQPSLTKRIKYATSFPYCNTGGHAQCAIYAFLVDGRLAPSDLLPNGGVDDYADSAGAGTGMKVVVLDDSAVFAMFAANAVAATLPKAAIVRCETYHEALDELADGTCAEQLAGGPQGRRPRCSARRDRSRRRLLEYDSAGARVSPPVGLRRGTTFQVAPGAPRRRA